MEVIFVVLPLALLLAGLALAACVRAIRSGQLDDLDTPPWRAILDDPPVDDEGAAASPRERGPDPHAA